MEQMTWERGWILSLFVKERVYIDKRGAYIIIIKEGGVYCYLDINVVDSTANPYNDSQSFEFFQVLERFCLVKHWKLDFPVDLRQTRHIAF